MGGWTQKPEAEKAPESGRDSLVLLWLFEKYVSGTLIFKETEAEEWPGHISSP